MKKITFAMLGITLALFLGISFMVNPIVANTVDSNEENRDVFLNIITCNKLQYDMVKSIVKNKHNVEFMFTNEKEANSFKYTDETVNNISNMDLFFYTGNQIEPWSNSLISELKKGKIGIINISRGIRSLQKQDDKKNSVDNPYYWTGFDEYKIALYNIKSAIQDKDPRNRNLYEENYNKAIEEIEKNIKELSKNKVDLKDYVYISVGDDLDYFYKNLGITTLKIPEGKTLDEFVQENKYDYKKVIVLKDDEINFASEPFKIVSFSKYDEKVTASQLLVRNFQIFYENIPNIEDK